MKIVYTADAGCIHTKRIAEWFANRGHDVHVISSRDGEINGVKVHVNDPYQISHRSPRFLVGETKKILRARRLIKELKPDILHGYSLSVDALYAATSGFHPLIVSAWGSDVLIHPKESLFARSIVKYVLKKADLIICDAEHMREAMIELGANPQKININYFGTDTQKFSPKQSSKELGVLNSPVIISLRNLEPVYDVKSLIASVPLVLKESSEAKFVIAGRGSQEARLRELATSLGVSGSIRFVGFIPNDELPEYLVSSDIYVSTALSDAGLAASTAEAMACEIPVVITDIGANREWVEDGISGFIVPAKDPKILAEKIIILLRNEDIRMKFGRISRKIVEERLDCHKEMEKMEKIYKKFADRSKK